MVKLLVVEDNREMSDILESFFSITPEVSLCGVAHDGVEAIAKIRELLPDVVLLDIIMPKMDGLSVLERLNLMEIKRHPSVIVTSAIGQENITNKALSLGADYYMIKPYSLPDLLNRVCLIAAAEGAEKSGEKQQEKQYTPIIAKTMMELGIPTNMLGYQYCIEAVKILLEVEGPCAMVKGVYTMIAEKYETTLDCVEGAIRKAIRRAYLKDSDVFRGLFLKEDPGSKQPSNGRFLTMLSETIKLKADEMYLKGE